MVVTCSFFFYSDKRFEINIGLVSKKQEFLSIKG